MTKDVELVHLALFFAALCVGEGWYDKYALRGSLHARTRAVVLFDRVINGEW